MSRSIPPSTPRLASCRVPATSGASAGLRSALARARASGKPLAVLIVPDSSAERRTRGAWTADWLLAAGDALLADLALCEVACAPAAAVSALAPSVGCDRSALLAWIEPAGAEPRAGVLAREPRRAPEPSVAERRAVYGHLHDRIQAALYPSARAAQQRASAAWVRLSESDVATVQERLRAPHTLCLDLVDRAAAWLRDLAGARPADVRAAVELRLARAARARLIDRPIAGTAWEQASALDERLDWMQFAGRGLP